jgi:hypothetical protein
MLRLYTLLWRIPAPLCLITLGKAVALWSTRELAEGLHPATPLLLCKITSKDGTMDERCVVVRDGGGTC